jgi:hypothetical protein
VLTGSFVRFSPGHRALFAEGVGEPEHESPAEGAVLCSGKKETVRGEGRKEEKGGRKGASGGREGSSERKRERKEEGRTAARK